MEKHICKLCSRSFTNGRALGGHMRSHMVNLPIPPKTQQIHQLSDEIESGSASSSGEEEEEQEQEQEDVDVDGEGEQEEEDKGLYYGLRENPKKSFRLVDPEFSFAVDAGSVVQDRESETESSRNPSRRRSKRNRKSGNSEHQHQRQPQQLQHQRPELKKTKLSKPSKDESPAELEPVSSVSDTTPEENVALCLMMLSRDRWMREEQEEEEEEVETEKSIEKTDESDELKPFPTRARGRYRCGTCKKVFRSYQALGGHRASHKKIKGCIQSTSFVPRTHEAESQLGNVATPVIDRKIHECPVCFRVFGSGQALGGHKRSHLSGSAASVATITANSTKFGDNLIDLNLPAPVDDDDISQVELSAVSDAEFFDPIRG